MSCRDNNWQKSSSYHPHWLTSPSEMSICREMAHNDSECSRTDASHRRWLSNWVVRVVSMANCDMKDAKTHHWAKRSHHINRVLSRCVTTQTNSLTSSMSLDAIKSITDLLFTWLWLLSSSMWDLMALGSSLRMFFSFWKWFVIWKRVKIINWVRMTQLFPSDDDEKVWSHKKTSPSRCCSLKIDNWILSHA